MKFRIDRSIETKGPTDDFSQKQDRSDSPCQFADNRPETVAQRKLQEVANNGPQVKKLRAFQEIADSRLIQSSSNARFAQQLMPDASPNQVIQRKIDTWGGSFSEENYEAKKDRMFGPELVGAYMKLTFTPNKKCPKDVLVGLIQIVRVKGAAENEGLQKDVLESTKRWAIDRASDSNPVYGSSDEDDKSKELTDNPPSIDQESTNPLDPNSGVIDVGAQLGKRKSGKGGLPAILTDDPRVILEKGKEQEMHFETTAVVLEGKYKGLALGTVSWGWIKPAGESEAQIKDLEMVNTSGSSLNLEDAIAIWNKASEEHELVPIPAILDSSTVKKGKCFITTACVEHMGLSDDCEELTTLRQFRDGYLLRRSDGKQLVSLYYQLAPLILVAIRQRDDEGEILRRLYGIILQCVDAVKRGDEQLAYRIYRNMMLKLAKEFAGAGGKQVLVGRGGRVSAVKAA